jgi:site-specific DNA-methyltransferase (adenine-specific)
MGSDDISVLQMLDLHGYAFDYQTHAFTHSRAVHADCFEWLGRLQPESLHAVVTDPPYGVKEYDFDQLDKKHAGVGGVWRLPPSFDGHVRSPLPRFTALDKKERESVDRFFFEWGRLVHRSLRPGGHVILASNSFLSQLVFAALVRSGLEFRGEMIRLVRTMRGGDRPKNAEEEFPGVCSLPRGCYEPWGIFRKPLPYKMTVAECLRTYGTGGLRRLENGNPFSDVVMSERTPVREREVADHPSLKPQSLMRQIVRAALPLGTGVIADPFMGSGSTLAAAEAQGLQCVGIERFQDYYDLALKAVPVLAAAKVRRLDEPDEQLHLL